MWPGSASSAIIASNSRTILATIALAKTIHQTADPLLLQEFPIAAVFFSAGLFSNPTAGPSIRIIPESLRPCHIELLTASGKVMVRGKLTQEESDFDLIPQVPGPHYLRLMPESGKAQFFKIAKFQDRLSTLARSGSAF